MISNKIGFSRRPVEKRIAGAAKSATYLMAPWKLWPRLPRLQFAPLRTRTPAAPTVRGGTIGRLNSRHGRRLVSATEWFPCPPPVIDRAIELIISGKNREVHLMTPKAARAGGTERITPLALRKGFPRLTLLTCSGAGATSVMLQQRNADGRFRCSSLRWLR